MARKFLFADEAGDFEFARKVADYCAWAIQRKWERDDLRSYELISQ